MPCVRVVQWHVACACGAPARAHPKSLRVGLVLELREDGLEHEILQLRNELDASASHARFGSFDRA